MTRHSEPHLGDGAAEGLQQRSSWRGATHAVVDGMCDGALRKRLAFLPRCMHARGQLSIC